MSTPAQNTMNVNTPASIATFQAKSAADKVLSYMWYIHVLVSVNTESRLRTKISRVLEEHSVSPNASSSPGSASSFDDQQRKSPDNHNQQQQQQPLLDLTDHLVLWTFSHTILTRLIDVPPVYAQANGYTCILADVPVPLREEFCRRLYTLLFSQHIVEWPHGIDVPEPCIPAAQPVLGATAAAAAAASDDVSIKLDNNTPPSSVQEDQEEEQGNFGGAVLDGAMDSQDDESSGSPASSSLRPAASIWLQTPSLSSWNSDEDIAHMQRATYFGTVSSPLPMDYFANWEWSRNESGPHRDSIDEQSMSGVQLMAPFSSPQQEQQRSMPNKTAQTGPCESNRIKSQSPHAHQQSRGTPSVMYGDDIEDHCCEVTGWSSSSHHDSGFPRFSRSGRVDMGHAASKQPFVSDKQRDLGLRWKRDSPVTGTYPMPANSPKLGYMASFLRSAEQAQVRQLAHARSDLQGMDAGRRVDVFRAT